MSSPESEQPSRVRAPRRLIIVAMACLAVAGATGSTGCGGGKSGGGSSDLFRVGSSSTVDSLNPFVAISAFSDDVANLIFPTLVQFDQNVDKIVPDFAKSWEIADDGLTITFKTHTGKWSDGEVLDAEDAAWSINLDVKFKDGPTGVFSSFVQGIERAEAPDPTTLVLHYKSPIAGALERLQYVKILPEQEWGKHAKGDGSGLARFAPKPPLVAGGPFQVERYDPQSVTLLTRNDAYYGDVKPQVDTLGLQTFTSPDALIAALQNGKIDAIDQLPGNISLDRVRDSGAAIGKKDGQRFEWLVFNSNPKKPKHRELLDKRVRQALSQAIDRKQIADVAWRGNAQPGLAILPTSNRFHNDAIEPPAFDPDAANKVLDGLGYRRGSDGIRVANGEKMSYEILSADSTNTRSFEIIRTGWEKVGVEVKQRILDYAGLGEAVAAPDNKYLEYDISMQSFNASPDPTYLISKPTCASLGNFGNEPYYCNRRYDALFEQQAATLDEGERTKMLHEMQAILAEDLPYMTLEYDDTISVHGHGWKNLVMSTYGFFPARLTKLPYVKVAR